METLKVISYTILAVIIGDSDIYEWIKSVFYLLASIGILFTIYGFVRKWRKENKWRKGKK